MYPNLAQERAPQREAPWKGAYTRKAVVVERMATTADGGDAELNLESTTASKLRESASGEYLRLQREASQMAALCEEAAATTAELLSLCDRYDTPHLDPNDIETKYFALKQKKVASVRQIRMLLSELTPKTASEGTMEKKEHEAMQIVNAARKKGLDVLVELDRAGETFNQKQQTYTERMMRLIFPGKELSEAELTKLQQRVVDEGPHAVLEQALQGRRLKRVACWEMVELNEVSNATCRRKIVTVFHLFLFPKKCAHVSIPFFFSQGWTTFRARTERARSIDRGAGHCKISERTR